MSTRCQIIINDKDKIRSNTAMIYQHYDGYPDTDNGVIANIVPFLKDFKKNRGLDDLEYLAARLLQYLINKNDKEKYTGYGICNQLHIDIEYLYIVTPECLYTYKVNEVTGKFTAEMTLVQKDYL